MIRPVIIDYGVGNLRSVQKAFERIGVQAIISDQADDVVAANAILLPGVGAFADAIGKLRASGMSNALIEAAVQRRTPILGICLGMQLLACVSDEHGRHDGLGLIPGKVCRLPAEVQRLALPHMGWNEVHSNRRTALFKGIPDGADFYFLHSYHLQCDNLDMIEAVCTYGIDFCCAVRHENITGVQFHPEKSQKFGRKVLENFIRLAAQC